MLQLVLGTAGSRTVVKDRYAHAPLQVMRPIYLDDTGTAYIYVLNPCGGILGGDTYTLRVTLEPGAHACITTPAATQIYTAREAPARQQVDFRLGDGAVLASLPGQIIPFAGAAFHQQTTVRLGNGALAFLGEILAPGRLARGERFAYREYRSDFQVVDAAGDIVVLERMRLCPSQQHLATLGLFEGYAYLGSFFALGSRDAFPDDLADRLHALLADRQGVMASATALACGGVAARLLGTDHHGVSQAMFDLWNALRQQCLGSPAVPHHR
jgi:urease accessory protein